MGEGGGTYVHTPLPCCDVGLTLLSHSPSSSDCGLLYLLFLYEVNGANIAKFKYVKKGSPVVPCWGARSVLMCVEAFMYMEKRCAQSKPSKWRTAVLGCLALISAMYAQLLWTYMYTNNNVVFHVVHVLR